MRFDHETDGFLALQPVYNFCVAIDDATMGITHVLRAEEHLPNTLRQMLVYKVILPDPRKLVHSYLDSLSPTLPCQYPTGSDVVRGPLCA